MYILNIYQFLYRLIKCFARKVEIVHCNSSSYLYLYIDYVLRYIRPDPTPTSSSLKDTFLLFITCNRRGGFTIVVCIFFKMVCVVNTIIEEISINRRGRLRVSTLNWGGGCTQLPVVPEVACMPACLRVYTSVCLCACFSG